MQDSWQTIVAIGITVLAGVYVAWYLWRSIVSGKSSCGSCSTGCEPADPTHGKPRAFVAIEQLDQHRDRQ